MKVSKASISPVNNQKQIATKPNTTNKQQPSLKPIPASYLTESNRKLSEGLKEMTVELRKDDAIQNNLDMRIGEAASSIKTMQGNNARILRMLEEVGL